MGSEVYCGKSAFDQVETANIRDFTRTLSPKPVLGHCFHSYSQLWLWPYGYIYNVHGTVFDPINSADLYPCGGAADDWYKSEGFRFSFTTELRDTGHYGFVLPPSQIIPSGEEILAGFEVVIV